MGGNNGTPEKLEELQNIIDFAIEREKEASLFYNDLVTKTRDEAVAAELRRIAGMEERHRERLESMDVTTAAKTFSREKPDLRITEEDKSPGPDMSWSDLITIAMHREQAAIDLYTDLEKRVSDLQAKQLLNSLATEEKGHKYFFQKKSFGPR